MSINRSGETTVELATQTRKSFVFLHIYEIRNHFDIGLNATYAKLSGKWNEVPKWGGMTVSQLI